MEELEKLHYEALKKSFGELDVLQPAIKESLEKASIELAKITKNIALDFNFWSDTSDEPAKFWRANRTYPSMDGSHVKIYEKNTKKLFELFLKLRYGKHI